ncbi:MAG: hypothetical protein PHN39_03905 [Candidatus Pacebacteria bacterium]|nr:hypothetical protein [Candidatus Paceibacterota bacterium]
MTLIVVHGLVGMDFEDPYITKMEEALTSAIMGMPELGVDEESIRFSFVLDKSVKTDQIPVSIIVKQLSIDLGKANEIIRSLAQTVGAESEDLKVMELKDAKVLRDRLAQRITFFFRGAITWRDLVFGTEVEVEPFDLSKSGFYAEGSV